MIRRCGIYRRAAFLSVVYSNDFSSGAVENTKGTYGYHSPVQAQFVSRGGAKLLFVTWSWRAGELLGGLGT